MLCKKIKLFVLKYEISILMYVITVPLVKFNGYLNVVVKGKTFFYLIYMYNTVINKNFFT